MRLDKLNSPFLQYLIDHNIESGVELPTLAEISTDLGMSVGKLREEVAYARKLGLLAIKPRVGMRRNQFDFLPAILPSILFSLTTGEAQFEHLSQLRRAIEEGLWHNAIATMQPEDYVKLHAIIAQAKQKLANERIIIPHQEHRDFHITFFERFDNPFVHGVLTAYWDVYEARSFGRYQTYEYWQEVWRYHQLIVDSAESGDIAQSLAYLQEHFRLLKTTPETAKSRYVPAT